MDLDGILGLTTFAGIDFEDKYFFKMEMIKNVFKPPEGKCFKIAF
jgi:hypothetical protein